MGCLAASAFASLGFCVLVWGDDQAWMMQSYVNALLVAASIDLYQALEKLLNTISGVQGLPLEMYAAEQLGLEALGKATGKRMVTRT